MIQFPLRYTVELPVMGEESGVFYEKALKFALKFDVFCLTDGNAPLFDNYPHGAFRTVLAIGVYENQDQKAVFYDLDSLPLVPEWLFGFIGYDVKNQLENLESKQIDKLGFPELYFFVPQHLVFFEKDKITLTSFDKNIDLLVQQIQSINLTDREVQNNSSKMPLTQKFLQHNFTKDAYINCVEKIKEHIIEGDVYELNFCMNFGLENVNIDVLQTFLALKKKSPMPFAAFFKWHDLYVLCASPERFMKKEGRKLISQPIKGTIKRGKTVEEDEILKQVLRNSEKEVAENMMIVDLVRNDLARTALTGTICVEEIFGIYTFPQVHQMISTVSAQLPSENSGIEAIENAFPMGSMTGAPKIKAMELIESYEKNKRGIFSGAIGYITPEKDFDFNVVIRSIFYHQKQNYLSFQAGSAITYDSVAAEEYEECLLKTKAIQEVIFGVS
jgi:para-aminobenzoate synthetase component 1